MNRKRSAVRKRFATAAVIALPMTVALLFLMTQLILPGEQNPIVNRMIHNIELQRAVSPPEPVGIQVFRSPPSVSDRRPPAKPPSTIEDPGQSKNRDRDANDTSIEASPVNLVDWWAEARQLTQAADEKALKRWLLEQGYDRYVSIMQGTPPITNSVRGKLPPSQEDATGYMNTFGDMEIKISENCVAQTQVSARLDISDFAKRLPMRVVCKAPPKFKFPFDRE